MDIRDLKEEILNRELLPDILSELGCHHIVDRGEYVTCGNKDGDNPRSIVVYKNEYINCTNYTRQITKDGRAADIFDLVVYSEDCSFAEAMKFVCDIAGVDYYGEREEMSTSRQLSKMLYGLLLNDNEEDTVPLKPIPNEILNYYLPYGNKMWSDEGISLTTQAEFGVAYDPHTNYITIPIYDDLGSLVGVKGRYFGEPDEYHSKYMYIENCNKSKVLYGYWQNKGHIKHSNYLIVAESEKSVLKLAEYGFRNVVATGGKTISKHQVELISRTGCSPVFAFDKDVQEDELKRISDMFANGITVYAVIDTGNLLNEKESPMDREQVWRTLYKDFVYKIK